MPGTHPDTSLDFFAPLMIQDLASPPEHAQELADAKGLLAHKRIRVLVLYLVSWAWSVAASLAFVWMGALLTGLPLEPGGSLHESYPPLLS